MKPIYFLKAAVVAVSFMSATGAQAQMAGNNVFLQGHHVEVGVGKLGYYGADTIPPAGYHPHCIGCVPSQSLGFVADPGLTGWDTSTVTTSSHYMGDYFTPGSPFEGWELQVDTMRCEAYNSGTASAFSYGGGMPVCTGSNIGYTVSGSKTIGTWQGTIDSITLTQITTIDSADMYFSVQIILTNTATTPRNDLYYIRTLDPDNDQTWPGGSFTTTNLITHQTTDTTVVTAVGGSSPLAYLALGTTDTAATAVIYNSWPLSSTTDLATAYNGTMSGAYFTEGVTVPGDIAIGLVINIPHLATVDSAADSVLRTTSTGMLHPANSATFSYFYSFSPAGTDSAIARSAIHTTPLGVRNVNNTTAINVYPNPSKEVINVAGLTTGDRISLYDMMGRDMNQNWNTTPGTATLKYNNVPAGGYILIVTGADGNVKARVPVRKS